jgi:hypothetical protein
MTHSRLLRPTLVLSCFAIVLAASCRESSVEPQRVARPMTGTYDFTTVLDTFSYETTVGAPGTCTIYCPHVSADSTGKLAGTFTVGDSVAYFYIFGSLVYREVSAAITGTFAGTPIQETYPSGLLSGPLLMPDAVDGSKVYVQLEGQTTAAVDLVGTVAGDSITGTAMWTLHSGSGHGPRYTGHFVARRRP